MVQEELMRQGHFKAAEHYILYRAQRSRLREEAEANAEDPNQEFMVTVTSDDGVSSFWDGTELKKRIAYASIGLDLTMPEAEIDRELRRSVGSEISEKDLKNTIILNAKALIEKDADVVLWGADVAGVFESNPWVAGFEDHLEHGFPKLEGGELAGPDFAFGGHGLVFAVALFEGLAVEVVEVGHFVRAE